MDYSKLYRTLQAGIRELSDEEVDELRAFIEVEIASRHHDTHYDPAKDKFLTEQADLDASPDLAEQVEDILYGDVQPIEKTHKRSS
jgi:hypothetical protein